MRKVVRLTERDITRIIRRIINESDEELEDYNKKSFNIPDFDYKGEQTKDNHKIEIFARRERGFAIQILTTIMDNGRRVAKVLVLLFGGETIDITQQKENKSWVVIKDGNDEKLRSLIEYAMNYGKFRNDYDNTPRL